MCGCSDIIIEFCDIFTTGVNMHQCIPKKPKNVKPLLWPISKTFALAHSKGFTFLGFFGMHYMYCYQKSFNEHNNYFFS